ncbi:MAG: hypothetical protein PHE55_05030 [Methylococcaceae bacterium]|nr:hypothetical protein [Methylococcaceae bacterium]
MNTTDIIGMIEGDEKWDSGELGQDEASTKAINLSLEQQQAIDDSVALQMISIRLPKSLIEDYKFLGDFHGIKYQTLMRQILARFADSEMKDMARKAANAQIKATRQAASHAENPPESRKRKKLA